MPELQFDRFNAYRIMWLIVYFDLPTETKKDRKIYTAFRKELLRMGFTMFQYSIYTRHCMSREHLEKYKRMVKSHLPSKGHIVLSGMTDKQFGMMEVFHGVKKTQVQAGYKQLELF